MDLHTLMSPYADVGAPDTQIVEACWARHRADGPTSESVEALLEPREPRHRADRAG